MYSITKYTNRVADLETSILYNTGICTTGRFVFRYKLVYDPEREYCSVGAATAFGSRLSTGFSNSRRPSHYFYDCIIWKVYYFIPNRTRSQFKNNIKNTIRNTCLINVFQLYLKSYFIILQNISKVQILVSKKIKCLKNGC